MSLGLADGLANLCGLTAADIWAPPQRAEACAAERMRQCQETVSAFFQGVESVERSEPFRLVDDGKTPVLVVILKGDQMRWVGVGVRMDGVIGRSVVLWTIALVLQQIRL